MFIRQFQRGARSLRSEIVSALKQNALSIFEINDIKITNFLDKKSREASNQLQSLRNKNAFLFASEEDLPDLDKAERYFRSRCISRVSPYFHFYRLDKQ